MKNVNPIWLIVIVLFTGNLFLVLYNQSDFFKDCSNCNCNSYSDVDPVRMDSEFNDTILRMEIQRTVQYMIFCDGGFPLGQTDDDNSSDQKVIDFIEFGSTIAVKRKNENLLTIIRNGRDRLRIKYTNVNGTSKNLFDFEIIE